MISKKFTDFTVELLEEMFGLVPIEAHPALQQWLTITSAPNETELAILAKLKQKLLKSVLTWNEEELKVKFIGPLLNLVDYDEATYQAFLERDLSATIGEVMVSGIVDFIIAQGRFAPKKPFFCLHEYKKERTPTNDPLGQLLIAMLVARQLNDDRKPLYGAYIVGRNWFFVVLAESEYAVSLAYDATQADINDIFVILKNLKVIIEKTSRS